MNLKKIGKIFAGDAVKYTGKWFHGRTDEELKEEREKVRKEFCTPGKDDRTYEALQKRLYQFDDEQQRRQYLDDDSYGFPAHGEHGLHLFDDE